MRMYVCMYLITLAAKARRRNVGEHYGLLGVRLAGLEDQGVTAGDSFDLCEESHYYWSDGPAGSVRCGKS